MKLPTFFTICLLAGLASTAPTSNDDRLVIDNNYYPESLIVYRGDHDIVSIVLPLNALNFGEDSDDEEDESSDTTVFFVQADTNDKGERIDQGLYVLINGNATKLLDHGRDAAAANDDTKTAYFAAKDGIYSYNAATKKAEKYGTVTDSLIGIAKVNGSDTLYVLTEDRVLYKVTEEGTKKEKIDSVVNAKQIVLDFDSNLFYSTTNNEVYILLADGVKKVEGLPSNPAYLSVIKPPFIFENGVPVIANDETYTVYANGTSEVVDIVVQAKPTAAAIEGTLIHYLAYKKNIYEYNILEIVMSEAVNEVKQFLSKNSDEIQAIATRSRNDLRA
ncbi:uncharacterized protein LOC113505653 [Trichoplusia ni]|uniref:Uncharacterized protein LOC113505653 n=1 Tax=Trichoplusia ni TaxID=7111 RepID=A0A7E5WVE3_TRINI|nr:uncharacterized protein LOC113505653 [Trichoplusia ni]